MKCLINCRAENTAWTGKYFHGLQPYMLRIANKPLLEFFVEFCTLCKIESIRFIMEEPDATIENYFQDGAKWNLKITYGTSRNNDTVSEILERNKLLLAGDDLLLANGFFFLHYNKDSAYNEIAKLQNNMSLTLPDGNGLYHIKKHSLYQHFNEIDFVDIPDNCLLRLSELSSVKELFELNMAMVTGEAENFIMPSYNNEPGVFIGQNVEITPDCKINKPVILGNNIQLKNFSKIGPCAIIGDNSLVDSQTLIQHSVLYGDSYIGSELEINHKIIYRQRLVDPNSGELLDVVDNFLVSEINNQVFSEFTIKGFHALLALLLLILQLPLFLLLRPLVGKPSKLYNCWLDNSGGKQKLLGFYERKSKNIAHKLFLKFSLDKYHLLFLCLKGKFYLAGNRILEASNENMALINQMPTYKPAIFSYSGMLAHDQDEQQSRIDELYYAYHDGMLMDIKIVIYTLIANLLKHVDEN